MIPSSSSLFCSWGARRRRREPSVRVQPARSTTGHSTPCPEPPEGWGQAMNPPQQHHESLGHPTDRGATSQRPVLCCRTAPAWQLLRLNSKGRGASHHLSLLQLLRSPGRRQGWAQGCETVTGVQQVPPLPNIPTPLHSTMWHRGKGTHGDRC